MSSMLGGNSLLESKEHHLIEPPGVASAAIPSIYDVLGVGMSLEGSYEQS